MGARLRIDDQTVVLLTDSTQLAAVGALRPSGCDIAIPDLVLMCTVVPLHHRLTIVSTAGGRNHQLALMAWAVAGQPNDLRPAEPKHGCVGAVIEALEGVLAPPGNRHVVVVCDDDRLIRIVHAAVGDQAHDIEVIPIDGLASGAAWLQASKAARLKGSLNTV